MLQYISQKKTQSNGNINRAHSNEKSNEKKCLSSFSNWSSLKMRKPFAMDSKKKHAEQTVFRNEICVSFFTL